MHQTNKKKGRQNSDLGKCNHICIALIRHLKAIVALRQNAIALVRCLPYAQRLRAPFWEASFRYPKVQLHSEFWQTTPFRGAPLRCGTSNSSAGSLSSIIINVRVNSQVKRVKLFNIHLHMLHFFTIHPYSITTHFYLVIATLY